MISIIIVGKNEGWRLTKCLASISKLIKENRAYDIETIYVDSKSSDDSLERAQEFNYVRIFQITGATNSAIARNIGAKEARGEILFFIDGDMENQSSFIEHAIDANGELKFDYLTGHLDDYFYTTTNSFIGHSPRTYQIRIPSEKQELKMNGGLFMIKKKVWDMAGGMRNKYKRSQDLDLTIRLKKKGIKIIRIPYFAAKHHTINYNDESRMWTNLLNKYSFYSALIFRDHLLNSDVMKRTIRSNYTELLLLVTGLLCFLTFSTMPIYIYFMVLVIRVFYNTKLTKSTWSKFFYFFSRVFYQISFDISFWIGFLFFYPKNHIIEYEQSKN